ncbi:hypothetical protein M0R45_007685 [Rubus argutus]|uniref:Cinnamyl alcohol dehydrogenase n=1 Tax=Rubus argutus TaxID=59490 RepID=A0AAW1Y107_RUBAR
MSPKCKEAVDSLDYIIDTIPVFHPLEPYLSLLKLDGKLILMGVINTPLQFVSPLVMLGRKTITGSFNDVRYRFVVDVAGSNLDQ